MLKTTPKSGVYKRGNTLWDARGIFNPDGSIICFFTTFLAEE